MKTSRLPGAVLLAAVLLAAVLVACSSSKPAAAPKASGPVYAKPGPFTAAVTTLTMGDTLVDVWYPAAAGSETGRPRATYELSDWLPAAFKAKVPPGTATFTTDAYRDLPASGRGPFPLVLFSHGFAGYRDQSTFLTTHLATWGFVVAAPDMASRDLTSVFGTKPSAPLTDVEVLRQTVDLMKAQDTQPRGPLNGRIDSHRLAVVGHSAGGFDAIQFGAQPDVTTYISLAAGDDPGNGSGLVPPAKPALYMVGADDAVVPATKVASAYAAAPEPKRLVTIGSSGHLAFADICLIGSAQGGVTTIARSLGITIPASLVKLAVDGCGADAIPVGQAYPIIDHFVVAQLRSVFGIDRHPGALGDGLTRDFAPATLTYQHAP